MMTSCAFSPLVGSRKYRRAQFQGGGHAGRSSSTRLGSRSRIVIRDTEPSDGNAIFDLLESDSAGFDPEGPLSMDCASHALLQESYSDEDGCFLVAVDGDTNAIVGTAGLIVGTQITHLTSGSSISTATTTGAIRRVCCNIGEKDEECSTILENLLLEVESRAKAANTKELIILAYQRESRPTVPLLKQLGYTRLGAELKGIDAVQFGKRLLD